MHHVSGLAEIGDLVGDPARAGTRALMVTPAGLRGFRTAFGVDVMIAEAA